VDKAAAAILSTWPMSSGVHTGILWHTDEADEAPNGGVTGQPLVIGVMLDGPLLGDNVMEQAL
jgi:hypothetical protein